jgi:poly(3-hydroxyalkanoate) synthetase
VTCPIYLLAGEKDHIVSIDQILATIALVGTPPHDITISRAPCGHLALFMGFETLKHYWPPITKWLKY